MKRLLILRHGRTEWNASGRFQGQLDPPLDELGREQAKGAARHLAGLGIEHIVTSDLQRAAHTADALAAGTGLKAIRDLRLRELHLGAWQGLTRTEAQLRFPEGYQAWVDGADFQRSASIDGEQAESYREVADRARECAHDVLSQISNNGLAALVTHGGTARALIGSMIELPEDTWWRLAPLGNCCWSLLLMTDRGWRLAEHGVGVQETAEPAMAPDIEPGEAGMAGF